jgi:hypothetical protein
MVPVLVQMYYGWFVQQVAELVARMCIPMYPVFFFSNTHECAYHLY